MNDIDLSTISDEVLDMAIKIKEAQNGSRTTEENLQEM